MLKFPYGLNDFEQMRREGYLYVDRTHFIPLIEEAAKQILFLRPHRFGKSILLSTLENYYDVGKTDQFEPLFASLAIGKNPTPLHNKYLILKWDFSGIQTYGTPAEIGKEIYAHLNSEIRNFITRYQAIVTYPIQVEDNALSSFQSLLTGVQTTPYKLYLLIDEYDNFANRILMSSLLEGQRRVKGEGIFRVIFQFVKSATAGRGLDRVFITGVTPLVMSDLASAYNVATNIYLQPEFNSICGFTETEVLGMLQHVAKARGLSSEVLQEAFAVMRTFYDGYCFSPRSTDHVYHPNLVFHYLHNLQEQGEYLLAMQNSNWEDNAIVYPAALGESEDTVAVILDEATELTTSSLSRCFGIADILHLSEKSVDYLAAFLYYKGNLTLRGVNELREYVLTIPNLVIREFYTKRI